MSDITELPMEIRLQYLSNLSASELMEYGRTSKQGYRDVERVIKEGKVEDPDAELLHESIYNGDVDMAKMLLTHLDYDDCNCPQPLGDALNIAVDRGYMGVVRMLAEDGEYYIDEFHIRKAMWKAIHKQDPDMVGEIIPMTSDINITYDMYRGVIEEGNPEVLRVILEAEGGTLDLTPEIGEPSHIIYAMDHKDAEMVRILLTRGEGMNEKIYGLNIAIKRMDRTMVRTFLRNGVGPDHPLLEENPMFIAGYNAVVEEDLSILGILLRHGGDPTVALIGMDRNLQSRRAESYDVLIHFLLYWGADPDDERIS